MSIVSTVVEHILWNDAQKHNEWASTKFWEHKLQKAYPAADGWIVSSQQPPTRDKSDRRRVETTVECLHGESLQKLQIVECKDHNASQSQIDEVEHQAYNACQKYLEHSGRSEMYAMTTIGTRARLWVARQTETYLEPFVPTSTGVSAIDEYIEAHSTDGHLITDGWEYMKVNHLLPPPRDQILKSQPNAEPAREGSLRYLPKDAQWVEVEIEFDGEGKLYYYLKTSKGTVRVEENDWEPVYSRVDGQDHPCYLYTGKTSGKHYWAWTIAEDDCNIYQGKGKGKGKGK